MTVTTKFTFLDGASAATTGKEMANPNGENLTVSVSGTFTGSIKFQGCLNGAWYDLNGVKLDDLEVYATVTAAGAYVVAGIEGFEKVRANLTAITSGSVTAVGRLTRTVA